MRGCTNYASRLNAPLPGRTNSSVCCCALRPHRFVISGSNSSPSHSSISESFVEAETCNQFYTRPCPTTERTELVQGQVINLVRFSEDEYDCPASTDTPRSTRFRQHPPPGAGGARRWASGNVSLSAQPDRGYGRYFADARPRTR